MAAELEKIPESGVLRRPARVSFVRFAPQSQDPWASKAAAERVESLVKQGLEDVAREADDVWFVDKGLPGEADADAFYEKLERLKDSVQRQAFLKKFCVQHEVTMLLFGTFSGDDVEMRLRIWGYNTKTDAVFVDHSEQSYRRDMPFMQVRRQVGLRIRAFIRAGQ